MYTWILLFEGGSVELCGGGEEDRSEFHFNQLGVVLRGNGSRGSFGAAKEAQLKGSKDSFEAQATKKLILSHRLFQPTKTIL